MPGQIEAHQIPSFLPQQELVDLVLQILSVHRIIDRYLPETSSELPRTHAHVQDVRVILYCVVFRPDCVCWWGHEEVVLEEAEEVLAEVVVGVQCCLGEGRTVQVVLRAVVDWKRGDVETTNMGVTWLT